MNFKDVFETVLSSTPESNEEGKKRPFQRANQQHLSKREPLERRALHSQMRDPDTAQVIASNDHDPPSRNVELGVYDQAVWKQKNPDRV